MLIMILRTVDYDVKEGIVKALVFLLQSQPSNVTTMAHDALITALNGPSPPDQKEGCKCIGDGSEEIYRVIAGMSGLPYEERINVVRIEISEYDLTSIHRDMVTADQHWELHIPAVINIPGEKFKRKG
eukprot:g33881.t1